MAETIQRERASPEEVEEAIRAIRAFYRTGKRVLKAVGKHGRSAGEKIRDLRKQLGWGNDNKVRKARQFADPVVGYTDDKLEELFRLLVIIHDSFEGQAA